MATSPKAAFFSLVLLVVLSGAHAGGDRLTETLTLRPLQDEGKVVAHFQFDVDGDAPQLGSFDRNEAHHYDLFPRALAEVVERLHVRELRVALTQGRWRADRWGYPAVAAPTGAQIYAWIDVAAAAAARGDDGTSATVDEQWQVLVNKVSGLLCASFNFVTLPQTSSPTHLFPFTGVHSVKPFNTTSLHLRYGHLPAETMCTENVTPWLKLLPCGSSSGLGSLLQSKRIFNSYYQSLSLHYVAHTQADRSQRRFASLSLVTVLPHKPAPGSEQTGGLIAQLFGGSFAGACPLASESIVKVVSPLAESVRSLPMVPQEDGLDIVLLAGSSGQDSRPAQVQIRRFIAGYGQQGGTLVTQLINTGNASIQVNVAEHYPWFLRVYLHTLTITTADGKEVKARDVHYLAPMPRHRTGLLELTLDLPAATSTYLSISFDYVYLHYGEHRPDANRGFDIGGSVVRIPAASPEQPPIFLYGHNLLASLPTPDFSMPYNVITFTSTLVALFFGSIFNMLTREFHVVAEGSDNSFIGRLKSRFSKKAKAD